MFRLLSASALVNAASWNNKTREQITPLTTSQNTLAAKVIDEINIPEIEASIKADIEESLKKQVLKDAIEAEVTKRANSIVQQQIAISQQWDKLREFETKAWADYNKFNFKAKLANVMELAHSQEALGELWSGVTEQEVKKNLNKIRMTFDFDQGEMQVRSEHEDAKGRPLYDWHFEPSTGQVLEVRHSEDGSEERVRESTISQAELNQTAIAQAAVEEAAASKAYVTALAGENATAALDKAAEIVAEKVPANLTENHESSASGQMTEAEWNEAEVQRDIAFKIMYFFIALVIITFMTLYAYFSMVSTADAQARAARARRNKGLMDDKSPEAKQANFVDFLSGSFDSNYVVNPNARMNMSNAVKAGATAVSIGLGMGTNLLARKDIEKAGGQEMRATDSCSDNFEFEADAPDSALMPTKLNQAIQETVSTQA